MVRNEDKSYALFVGNNAQLTFKDGGTLTIEDAKTSGVVLEVSDGKKFKSDGTKWTTVTD